MGIIGEVAAGYRLAPVLTHAIRVRRLYRRALKLTESWACDRVRGAARMRVLGGAPLRAAAAFHARPPACPAFNPPLQELWLRDAAALRARFDAAASATPAAAARLLREGEEEALRATHPDLYTVAYMPGGSKFMRNPPLPLGVSARARARARAPAALPRARPPLRRRPSRPAGRLRVDARRHPARVQHRRADGDVHSGAAVGAARWAAGRARRRVPEEV